MRHGAWLTDMDGVLIREDHPLDGAPELVHLWNTEKVPYAVLTNNSSSSASEIATRLAELEVFVPSSHIWTAAEATAEFLVSRASGRGVFVIGESGMYDALQSRGIPIVDDKPAFVVVGDTREYSYEVITTAVRHILNGAGFIAASPDPYDPGHDGPLPSTGALCALMTAVTSREPYVIGKPGPAMFRSALQMIGAQASQTTMIGDRLDTDIRGGIDAGLRTVLVRSGVADDQSLRTEPIAPDLVVDSVAALMAYG